MFRNLISICIVLFLGLTTVANATEDYVLGNWESPDSNDGWSVCDWSPDGNTVLTPGVATGATLDSNALKVENDFGFKWALIVDVNVAEFQAHDAFTMDITRLSNEWTFGGSGYNGIDFRINSDTSGLVDLGNDNSWWSPPDGNSAITRSWDYSAYKDSVGDSPSYLQFIFATSNSGYTGTQGIFYLDNAKLVREDETITIEKCKVKAGKTQGEDMFIASGTLDDSSLDLNDVTEIDVNIISQTDSASIYSETIDFNETNDVVNGKFKYTYKIPKGEAGAITNLKIDFTNNTFVLKTKKIDLTGLASPIELDLTFDSEELYGEVNDTIINGSRKLIPTRLMRTYQDTLIVTKVKVRDSDNALSDVLCIKGDIAVEDINDSNLADEEVIITWGSDTFTIPDANFVVVKNNKYKCSKIATAEGGLVTALIDLDKCIFKVLVKNATLTETSGDVDFGISFASYDETDEATIP